MSQTIGRGPKTTPAQPGTSRGAHPAAKAINGLKNGVIALFGLGVAITLLANNQAFAGLVCLCAAAWFAWQAWRSAQ